MLLKHTTHIHKTDDFSKKKKAYVGQRYEFLQSSLHFVGDFVFLFVQ